MLKALLVFGVAIGILLAAAQFMRQHHSTAGPVGPVQVNVSVPNPLGGSPSGRPDKIVVP